MGNNQSINAEEKKSYIQQNLHFVKQVENDAYGEVKIMKNELNQEILAVKQYSFQDRDRLDNFIKRTEKRKQLISPYIVELIDVEADKAEDFCSNFFKLSLVYQYHPENLFQLIEKRKKLRKRFTEQELFLLIDCVSSALLVFDSFELRHGDIRPQTILISQDNKFKLTDVKFLTQFSQYKRLLIGVSDTNYLSPQLFYQMEHRIANPEHNETISDIFSLGLICLEMASMRSIQGIYDPETFQIQEEKVEKIIYQMKEDKYSESLIELILRMLQIEENDRINPYQIQQYLDPIRDSYQNIKLLYTTTKFGERSYIGGDHSQNPFSQYSQSQFNSPDSQSIIVKNHSAFLSRKQSFNQSNGVFTNRDGTNEQQLQPPAIIEQAPNHSQAQSQIQNIEATFQPKQEDQRKHAKMSHQIDEDLNEDSQVLKQMYLDQKQNEGYQQQNEVQQENYKNSNYQNDDMQDYWEKSLHNIDQDVENVLNETIRLQQQYNKMPKLNLDETDIDNLITRRLENKNESLMNTMYQHKHSHSTHNTLAQPLSSSNFHNTQRQRNSNQSISSKHYLHSDTRSLSNLSQAKLVNTLNNTRQNSPKNEQQQELNQKNAIPLSQDYIDKQQGNNNLYDLYLNEYKKLVNIQNQQNQNNQDSQNFAINSHQVKHKQSKSFYNSKY
ncbi:kinase domain protein (macronuclear) [Tetrahymena thermophila SB210]|uniref:Kinase domain protein n=1 Tax=Tetrahymena thermophila (strain SB210) TaxID=312017 RepID=Q22TH5_TETTS|nr:kinase domain protein [Tetrahymena thermophila SB210]EAR88463.1 kinase domain protein [Tetrahymena thermophila SB210]|eukprot:XP_001008708.1 kinase domain protein [Tetrahymena thermophila SB210]